MFLLKKSRLAISLVFFSLLGLAVSGCDGQKTTTTKGTVQKSQELKSLPLDDIKLKGVD